MNYGRVTDEWKITAQDGDITKFVNSAVSTKIIRMKKAGMSLPPNTYDEASYGYLDVEKLVASMKQMELGENEIYRVLNHLSWEDTYVCMKPAVWNSKGKSDVDPSGIVGTFQSYFWLAVEWYYNQQRGADPNHLASLIVCPSMPIGVYANNYRIGDSDQFVPFARRMLQDTNVKYFEHMHHVMSHYYGGWRDAFNAAHALLWNRADFHQKIVNHLVAKFMKKNDPNTFMIWPVSAHSSGNPDEMGKEFAHKIVFIIRRKEDKILVELVDTSSFVQSQFGVIMYEVMHAVTLMLWTALTEHYYAQDSTTLVGVYDADDPIVLMDELPPGQLHIIQLIGQGRESVQVSGSCVLSSAIAALQAINYYATFSGSLGITSAEHHKIVLCIGPKIFDMINKCIKEDIAKASSIYSDPTWCNYQTAVTNSDTGGFINIGEVLDQWQRVGLLPNVQQVRDMLLPYARLPDGAHFVQLVLETVACMASDARLVQVLKVIHDAVMGGGRRG